MSDTIAPLLPTEGLAVLHLFYDINRSAWECLTPEQRDLGRQRLQELIVEAKSWEKYQVITVSMIGRADLGLMIVGPDLQKINELEKRIARALGPDVLSLVYSYFSLTEKSEYTQTEEQYRDELTAKEKLQAGSAEFEQKLVAFRERSKNYTYYRLYPTLPDWEFYCFYPMSKRRDPGQNWYAQEYEDRREMMLSHGMIGRKYSGRILQLISGSVGLDDWEWGVTLFSHNPVDIKAIIYEMRFDKATRKYADFGEFFTGLPLPLPAIYQRLGLLD